MVTTRISTAALLTLALASCNYNHPLDDDEGNGTTSPLPATSVAATVIDYSPMPGQFINTTPPYSEGDDAGAMTRKANEYLKNGYIISLGSWGGSITLHLDEPIYHRPSGRDFRVLGNAFYKNRGAGASGQRYGASEPGIISVSADSDHDGQPDCWYEIAGSEHHNSEALYSITYSRNQNGNVDWTASDGQSGTIEQNKFHTQPYFPQWVTDDKLMFTGRRLPDNGLMLPTGAFSQRCFDFGYADNQPDTNDASIINLNWAIDSEGNSVELPSISFIRIYTGVFQTSHELGECSTEICGIEIPGE